VADVLLTHSYHLPYDPKQVRKMQPYPPLGTLCAASALCLQGISVAAFDTMLHDPTSGLPEALRRHRPKIVAIYEDDFNFLSKMCLTRMRDVAWQIAGLARSAGAIVIAHGSDATDHAEEYLHGGVDFILLGEAEQALSELCSALLHSDDLGDIAGLVRLDAAGHVLHSTVNVPKNPSWINLPAPARELIDLEPYRQAWIAAHGYFSTSVVASRGCPYRCNWCAKPISGDRFHIRPAEVVAAEIRELKDRYGVQHIWFSDDVFALNHRWVQQFALAMETKACVLPFKIQSRADLMSMETVTALKRAGCAEVWMGIESGSQKVLEAMDKGLSVSKIRTARERLERADIRACYFLQLGYPGETWEDIQQTVELVRSTHPNDIGISLSYPLPGTPFYERVQAQLGAKRNWTDSDDLCVMFKTAYSDEFYRALRDALHAEVDSWWASLSTKDESDFLGSHWQRVYALESVSRNAEATRFHTDEVPSSNGNSSQFVPLQQLSVAATRE